MQSPGNENLDKLLSNLEFENQQFVKLIEKERQQIEVLERNIEDNKCRINQVQVSTENLDEETKTAHKQFTQNRHNCESLKTTSDILSQHETALEKKLELSIQQKEEERVKHESVRKHYQDIWEDYSKEYKSWPLAQKLEKKEAEAEAALQSLKQHNEELKKWLLQVKTSEEKFKGFKDANEMGVKLAQLKVDTLNCKKEMEKQLKSIEDLKVQIENEEIEELERETLEKQTEETADIAKTDKSNQKASEDQGDMTTTANCHQLSQQPSNAQRTPPQLQEPAVANTGRQRDQQPRVTASYQIPTLNLPLVPPQVDVNLGLANRSAPSLVTASSRAPYLQAQSSGNNWQRFTMPSLQVPVVSTEARARWPSSSHQPPTVPAQSLSTPVISITPPQLPITPTVKVTPPMPLKTAETTANDIVQHLPTGVPAAINSGVPPSMQVSQASSALPVANVILPVRTLLAPPPVTLPSKGRMPPPLEETSITYTMSLGVPHQNSKLTAQRVLCQPTAIDPSTDDPNTYTTPGRPLSVASAQSTPDGYYQTPPESPMDLEKHLQKLRELGEQSPGEPLFSNRPMYQDTSSGNRSESANQPSPFVQAFHGSSFGETAMDTAANPQSMFGGTCNADGSMFGDVSSQQSPAAEDENSFGFNFTEPTSSSNNGIFSMFGSGTDDADAPCPGGFSFNFGEPASNEQSGGGFSLF